MNSRFIAVMWGVLALAVVALGVSLAAETPGVIPVLLVIAGITGASFVVPRLRRLVGAPVRALRRAPILYWLVVLVFIAVGWGIWVVRDQPTNGRLTTNSEYFYLACLAWGLLYLLFYDVDTAQARMMGGKLSRNPLSGVMVTLTTILLLFMAAETWMRVNYVTTDGYGFTAMNYHWYKNFYWGHYNSVGFRDYEPIPDAQTRIAVLGDSFAMGHGINNIDDTFPQLVERGLGDGYDVNVVAQSGWDSDVQLFQLQSYPLRPNIVILSYYLNDIDYLLTNTADNPDSHFTFPDNPLVSDFILNFFVPNYIYYNLLQFTSTERASNHLGELVDAHLNEEYWSIQAQRLFEIVNWTRSENMRLIVLLWPHVTALDASLPATTRVREFFEGQGVAVVDMTNILRGHPSPGLIVNRFDTHPGVDAQRLAAESLLEALRSDQQVSR